MTMVVAAAATSVDTAESEESQEILEDDEAVSTEILLITDRETTAEQLDERKRRVLVFTKTPLKQKLTESPLRV